MRKAHNSDLFYNITMSKAYITLPNRWGVLMGHTIDSRVKLSDAGNLVL